MNLKSLFIILNIFNLASVVSVILIIIEYKQAYLAMENAYISKNKSFLLADELRQSSDDLTRLVRTYVITTEPRFKAQYYQILAIRNGLYPRPKNYNHIYWDFLSVEGSSDVNHPQEKAIALQELMVQAGFTKEELSLLTKSQHQSDELVRLEEKAMNAVNGMFEDDQGYYTIIKEPDLVLARELLHSNTYHEAKVKIMKPLDEFFKLLESRTDGIIHDAKEYVKQVEELLNLMVFVMIIVLTTSTGIMFHRILYPLISLKKSMLLLAKNDTSATIPEKSYNDEIGGMIEAIKVFKDNTERLIISEQKVKLLFDSVGEGFVGLNIRGNITFVNPVASQLLGYESQELWGKPFYRMFHAHTVVSKMSKLLLNDSAKKSKGVLEFKRQDDTVFPVEYTSTPILDPENNIEGAVIVFSDITKRKKHDDALKLAKETAEYANHSKTLFLANMSHELRTPLNAILGFAQLILKDTNITTVQKENLKTIHKSGKHLLSIISEILEVAKLQAGKIEITNAAFDIHSFLDNIILVINNRAESKNLEFTYDNYTTIPRFLICDEQRLRQVLFNLLGNAIKFTQNGEIHLGITYENNHIAFAIKDTGTGIKEKDLQVIFKPFEQIKSSQQHHQGTGLGLAITQELVILMGGEIKVASSLGVGSQFSFSIAAEATNMGEITTRKNTTALKAAQAFHNTTILVVDDIVENRSLLVQILQHMGFQTSEAENGVSALKQVEIEQPDIIFMDIQMPDMDGFTVIDKIRSGAHCPNIPIVLVSANVFDETKNKAIEEGANAFIEKPIKEEDIILALQKLLKIIFITQEEQKTISKESTATDGLQDTDLEQILVHAKVLNADALYKLFDTYEDKDPKAISTLREHLYEYDFPAITHYCHTHLISNND